jgi:hypothetical protein
MDAKKLTEDHKLEIQIATQHLAQYHDEKDVFPYCIITGYDTWVHVYEPWAEARKYSTSQKIQESSSCW